eukprot:TRINITY_DN944_c0_g1_i1.p1 TRINITY_DN944_c0_g1~~TRINITY_DN944_c0_g1_i1.p1  ORF type:complete len:163 (-),score=41.54 TRINITY_DN944_c0_g1_i1:169-657(-)
MVVVSVERTTGSDKTPGNFPFGIKSELESKMENAEYDEIINIANRFLAEAKDSPLLECFFSCFICCKASHESSKIYDVSFTLVHSTPFGSVFFDSVCQQSADKMNTEFHRLNFEKYKERDVYIRAKASIVHHDVAGQSADSTTSIVIEFSIGEDAREEYAVY